MPQDSMVIENLLNTYLTLIHNLNRPLGHSDDVNLKHHQAMQMFVETMKEGHLDSSFTTREWTLTHTEAYSHRHWSSPPSHPHLRIRGQLLLPETRPETVLNWLVNEHTGASYQLRLASI